MRTAEDINNKKKSNDLISVNTDTSIYHALRVMIDNKAGSVLVKDGEKIVGIWTERDLMRDTLAQGFDPQTSKIVDYMSTTLQSCAHTDTVYDLMDKFLGLRLRHLLVEKDGAYIGLISIGDVVKASLREKDKEYKNLNKIASWEYYEDWKWREDSK